MKWVLRAKEKGAKLIVVDPRFTRTAAKSGYICANAFRHRHSFPGRNDQIHFRQLLLYFKDYVVNYTNAPFLVNPNFKRLGELKGLFSGYDEKTRKYDKKPGHIRWTKKVSPKDPSLKDQTVYFSFSKNITPDINSIRYPA